MHQKILTMWALTISKDFRIAPCIRKIDIPKLFTLGMNHPVRTQAPACKNCVRPGQKLTLQEGCSYIQAFSIINPHLGLFGPSNFCSYIQDCSYKHGPYMRAPVYAGFLSVGNTGLYSEMSMFVQ